ncbi:PilZ domain-containing protein [Sphingomonas daechungensis]|uniref:PilZ domain-containing protein n=3 Tax=Sphingomonas daechungensis TaxID=1176646 RepID=A0ABX6T0I9_9SPHN|nr:PilZ domain-containing protein [Sphingomonas daechungensis]
MKRQASRMSLRAQLEIASDASERRRSRRRKLRIESEGSAGPGQAVVTIHDLSEEGLLVETASALSIGEVIDVVLPEAGPVQAEVAWTSSRFFGCKFRKPIATAAVSAALLQSPASTTQPSAEVVEKALQELDALSFAIKRVTRAVDQAIDRLNKPKD